MIMPVDAPILSSQSSKRPLLLGTCLYDGKHLRVRSLAGARIEIFDPPPGLVSLLAECIGERTLDDLMLDVLPGERCDVRHALAILYEERVLTSGSNVFGHLHEMSSNPSLWCDDAPSDDDVRDIMASPRYVPPTRESASCAAEVARSGRFVDLISQRRSAAYHELSARSSASRTRFAALDLVSVAYRNHASGTKPVPSAGRLWPVVVHVFTPTDDHLDLDLLSFDDVDGTAHLIRTCAVSEILRTLVEGSGLGRVLETRPAIIVLSIDPHRVNAKYRSRGYRFALIEVGAILQTIHLRAAERGFPVRAIGGFRDRDLARLVDPSEALLPTLLILTRADPSPA